MPTTALFLAALATGVNLPKTRAEITDYKETSTYLDVIGFCEELAKARKTVKLTYSGKSTEGKPIPTLLISKEGIDTANEAAKSGRILIYIQANIHAGEVEGKEAALHLSRQYSGDRKLLEDAIFIVQPIYNIDGNEKFAPQAKNRPGQNGPELVGIRANGQGLDLNRDCTKAESPEMRGALQNIYSWNPHVLFDLHTTDGTRHGYPLTYGGPGHPNTHPELQKYAFERFFPEVRRELRRKFRLETFDYGNAVQEKGEWRFDTFAGDARFVTNYAGLRGILPILSEAIVYEPFDVRIRDTERFVDACVRKVVREKKKFLPMIEKVRSEVTGWGESGTHQLATRFKLKLRGKEELLLEKDLVKNQRRTGPVREIERVKADIYDRFEGAEFTELPYAYLVHPTNLNLLKLLNIHGVQWEQFTSLEPGLKVQKFTVSEFNEGRTPFQGHKLIGLRGAWKDDIAPKEGILVRTSQPLGLVAFELLEPQCLDGATTWGVLGSSFPVGIAHPVLRVKKVY